ncbi:MAG: cation:proton antiporter [Bacteroidales bacterium]
MILLNSASTLHIEGLISDLALILMLGGVATLIFRKLNQPVVLGYIVAGFLASPHFDYLPNLTDEANIEFWGQIGIIVLLFSLGLEFSFKKLVNVGGSAVVTALIIVLGMMGFGFAVGQMLNFTFINSLFLGGMLSMSSTTIIIKALTDLNLKGKKFATMVFAVLICEDLYAVIMMVVLSSIAINNSVESSEMIYSILGLLLFLILWFTVGVFVIPSIFNYFRRVLNDELLLIISMGLCFSMAVFSAYSGFSMALGAFVMGSILAGTCEAEHIEKVLHPVKDLFGAVFFISVGMMVDPAIILEFAFPILILSVVVIVGMITFGTFGMLATGQTLRVAIQSGFSLTQIGEFSFIIATLGMSLKVLDPNIYPIIVAVSVITTFFTPYFIKMSVPFANWLEQKLPKRLNFLINRYSSEAANMSESGRIWRTVLSRYMGKIILYVALYASICVLSIQLFFPFMVDNIPSVGKLFATVITLSVTAPFILALLYPTIKSSERKALIELAGGRTNVPLVVMSLLRLFITISMVVIFLTHVYSVTTGLSIGIAVFILLVIVMSRNAKRRLNFIESIFINNLNVRELRRSGKNNNIVSDLHVAYITVGYNCAFVGERIINSNLREEFGISIVSIQRGGNYYVIPKSDMRIFPADILGVVGTDDQISTLLEAVEDHNKDAHMHPPTIEDMKLDNFTIKAGSALIGSNAVDMKLSEKYSVMLLAVQRGETEYIKDNVKETFCEGDILWMVGNKSKIVELRKL